MLFEKGIPALNSLSIDPDRQLPRIADKKPVKNHPDMTVKSLKISHEGCMVWSVELAAEVDLPPDNHCPALGSFQIR